MGSSRRASLSLLALLFALLPSAAALAQPHQPTPQDLETATNLYKEGKQLREKGDILGALEKLRAAHALGQTPVTGNELARTYVVVSKIVEARQVCLEVLRFPVQTDETEKSANARTDCRQLVDELKPRIPALVVKVTGAGPGERYHVAIDGAPVPDAAVLEPQKVDPGRHEVVVSAGEGPTARQVKGSTQVDEGVTIALPLVLPPAPEAPPPPPPPEEHRSRWTPLTIVGFSVAGVGAIIGSAAGVVAIQKKNDLPRVCVNMQCDDSNGGKAELDGAVQAAHISEVGFEIGAVGLAFGVAGLLIGPSKAPAQQQPPPSGGVTVKPWVSFGGAGLHGSF